MEYSFGTKKSSIGRFVSTNEINGASWKRNKKAKVKSGSKKAEVKSGSKKVTQKTIEHYEKIVDYLEDVTSAKAPEIAKVLNIKSTRVNELLRELEKKGDIVSEGTYRNRKYMKR